SGYANLAAKAYGTPEPMVAKPPDNDAIMPGRNLMSRAYQLAEDPESQVMMLLSGKRGESSQKTRSEFTGSPSSKARASILFHQSATFSCMRCLQRELSLRSRNGINASNVALLSPTKPTSTGYLRFSMRPSRSIWTARA